MVVSMDASDADAVRHLLTATQRFATRALEAYRRQQEQEQQQEEQQQQQQQQQEGPRRDNDRYQYRFDDFENFDEDSDDERDFRDLSHYTSIDPVTGKVKELWLGIIDVHGITSIENGDNDNGDESVKHWRLSESDWAWLSRLDQLEHLKLTGCAGLPHRQLKELRCLKHISCSECGNIASGVDDCENNKHNGAVSVSGGADSTGTNTDTGSLLLPQIRSISLRCGFQPNPSGIRALRDLFRYIRKNLMNLERITIWRLDQPLRRGEISSTTTAFQREQYRRLLVEALLEELAGGTGGSPCDGETTKPGNNNNNNNKRVRTLELNRCGLTSEDFRRLMFETLPNNFPSLQRLSLSSNQIDELPEIQRGVRDRGGGFATAVNGDKAIHHHEPSASFSEKKRLVCRLRRNLEVIHLSNNPVMEFLGKSGDEHRQLVAAAAASAVAGEEDAAAEGGRDYRFEQRQREEENGIVLRRSRRIRELEKLRDWLRLLPKLSQLGYVSCVHNVMRSTTEDFVLAAKGGRHGGCADGDGDVSGTVVSFLCYSKELQRQIEYYLRVNMGGRWLVEGVHSVDGDENAGYENQNNSGNSGNNSPPLKPKHLVNFFALWPNILEWSYRKSARGYFLLPLPAPYGGVNNNNNNNDDGGNLRNDAQTTRRQEQSSAVYIQIQHSMAFSRKGSSSGAYNNSLSRAKNATAMYHLLRQGPALCGGQQ